MSKILSPYRANLHTYLAFESNTLDNGRRGAAGWVQEFHESDDGRPIQKNYPPIDPKLYIIMGRIVTSWSVLEFVMDEMTQILVESGLEARHDWRKSLSFKQRLTLHGKLMRKKFEGFSRIRKYHGEVLDMLPQPKKIRDGIAHSLVVEGLAKIRPAVAFIERGMRLPTEKIYTIQDLDWANSEICHASGFLEMLACPPDPFPPFESREIFALQEVFGRDRWIQAKRRALKIRTQS